MKTKKDWDASGRDLCLFLVPGDEVDDAMYDYFVGVLPPLYGPNIIQISEPVTSGPRGERYATIETVNGHHIYRGLCLAHTTDKGVSDAPR